MTDCPHDRLQLVEDGYIRTWDWERRETVDGETMFVAVFHGLEDFSDEGDSEYYLQCKSCLKQFPVPDEWEWD